MKIKGSDRRLFQLVIKIEATSSSLKDSQGNSKIAGDIEHGNLQLKNNNLTFSRE